MRLSICIILLIRCCITDLNAQYYNQQENFLKANSVWCLGDGAGLNFNTGSPPPSIFQTATDLFSNLASVADPVTGELLFYTNGLHIWNANHEIMPNGRNLLTNTNPSIQLEYGSGTQQNCIVPVIGSPNKYYVFYKGFPPGADYFPHYFNRSRHFNVASLCYSIVDMSLDSGRGDVITWQKNIPLSNDTFSSGGMIAIPGNNCDIWLLVHKYRHPEFLAYHITAQGINPSPVVSVAGTQIQGDSTFHWPPYPPYNAVAYTVVSMSVSPNREHVALMGLTSEGAFYSSADLAGVLLLRFDASTGVVSEGIRVTHALPSFFNPPFALPLASSISRNTIAPLAFSPDNTKLYVGLGMVNIVGMAGIFHRSLMQYDIKVYDSLSIANSAIAIDTIIPNGCLKLYNDSIYITESYIIHRINSPDLTGQACDLQKGVLSLFPSYIGVGILPDEVVYPLPPDTLFYSALDTVICTKNSTSFRSVRLSAEEGYSGYEWDNGSTNQQRIINDPGTYWVISKDACHSRVDTFRFRYIDIPFSLGNDTAVCNGEAIELTPSGLPSGALIRWQDNSFHEQYLVTQSGTYWSTVTYEGCTLADTIKVLITDVQQYLGDDSVICRGEPIQLTLKANVPEHAAVLWSTGATTATLSVTEVGIYWVKVSEPPCMGSDSISISHELCTCLVRMPNAFSPNGDGTNDVFLPVIEPGCSIEQFSFNIYNRFGQRIFSSFNSTTGWDGRHNGIQADAGTYFFEVSFTAGTRKERFYQKGDLSLIK